MSKGSRRRPKRISQHEESLRWELFRCKNDVRKAQIRLELRQLAQGEKLCPGNSDHTIPLTPCSELGVYNCKCCGKTYKFEE